VTRASKPKTSLAVKQARIRAIERANQTIKVKADALKQAGLLSGKTRDILAAKTKGVAGLSGSARYKRRQISKLFSQVTSGGADLVDRWSDGRLVVKPTALGQKARKVSPEIAARLKAQGYQTVSVKGQEHVLTQASERVSASGSIIEKRQGYEARVIPFTEDMFVPNSKGVTPLYSAIKRRFAENKRRKNPQLLGFQFQVNEGKHHREISRFSNAEDMYHYLINGMKDTKGGGRELRYRALHRAEEDGGDDEAEALGGLVIMTYPRMNEIAKKTGSMLTTRKFPKRAYKPVSSLTPRQAEQRRINDKKRYAIKKLKKRSQ
jgi:hypothetical protein